MPETFRQWAERYCFERGMFPDMAKAVVDALVASPVSRAMEGRWGDPVEGYPATVAVGVTLALRSQAVAYIDAKMPAAWFRPLFTEEMAVVMEGDES